MEALAAATSSPQGCHQLWYPLLHPMTRAVNGSSVHWVWSVIPAVFLSPAFVADFVVPAFFYGIFFLDLALQPSQSFCDFPIFFLLKSSHRVNYTDWVSNVGLALRSCDKSHLAVIYCPSTTWLDFHQCLYSCGYCLCFYFLIIFWSCFDTKRRLDFKNKLTNCTKKEREKERKE